MFARDLCKKDEDGKPVLANTTKDAINKRASNIKDPTNKTEIKAANEATNAERMTFALPRVANSKSLEDRLQQRDGMGMQEATSTAAQEAPKTMPTALQYRAAKQRKEGPATERREAPKATPMGARFASAKAPAMPATTTTTTMTQQMTGVAAASETAAMPAAKRKTTKTASGKMTFTQFMRYKQILAKK